MSRHRLPGSARWAPQIEPVADERELSAAMRSPIRVRRLRESITHGQQRDDADRVPRADSRNGWIPLGFHGVPTGLCADRQRGSPNLTEGVRNTVHNQEEEAVHTFSANNGVAVVRCKPDDHLQSKRPRRRHLAGVTLVCHPQESRMSCWAPRQCVEVQSIFLKRHLAPTVVDASAATCALLLYLGGSAGPGGT